MMDRFYLFHQDRFLADLSPRLTTPIDIRSRFGIKIYNEAYLYWLYDRTWLRCDLVPTRAMYVPPATRALALLIT